MTDANSRRAEKFFALTVLLAFAALDGFVLVVFIASAHAMFPDFFAFWSFGRFVQEHPATEIYNQVTLMAFQHSLDAGFQLFYPYGYPPSFLLLLGPLAWFSFATAYLVWVLAGLVAYVAVAARLIGDNNRERLLAIAALLVAPTTIISVVYGQTGFLTAALLIGALLLLRAHPILAGILLGALTFKPQLGLLIPVALVAAGAWRTIAAAAGTLAGLVVASSMAYGWSIWPRWATGIVTFSGAVETMRDAFNRIMVTPTAGLLMLGLDRTFANVVQALLALAAAIVIWIAFRRGKRPLAIAALLVGSCLATPFAFVYDMPMVTAGVLLYFAQARRTDKDIPGAELLLLVLALVAPVFILGTTLSVPVVPISLLLLFAMIARRVVQQST